MEHRIASETRILSTLVLIFSPTTAQGIYVIGNVCSLIKCALYVMSVLCVLSAMQIHRQICGSSLQQQLELLQQRLILLCRVYQAVGSHGLVSVPCYVVCQGSPVMEAVHEEDSLLYREDASIDLLQHCGFDFDELVDTILKRSRCFREKCALVHDGRNWLEEMHCAVLAPHSERSDPVSYGPMGCGCRCFVLQHRVRIPVFKRLLDLYVPMQRFLDHFPLAVVQDQVGTLKEVICINVACW